MPLYSDNYYNGPSQSAYHLPSSSYLSPTSRISTPYSFSYLSPITSMLSSSIGTNPMPRGLRSYSPMLSAIPESNSPLMTRRDISGHRNSPRHLPAKTYYRSSRPVIIDTENIDVSKRKKENELESTPGLISRGKTIVRMHTKKLKENPELKKKKTQAELLMEKYLIKEKPIKEEEIPKRKRIWEEREEQISNEPAQRGTIKRSNTVNKKPTNSLPSPDVTDQGDNTIPPRKMSIDSELLKEEAALFDCMIQEELGSSNLKEMVDDENSPNINQKSKSKRGTIKNTRKKSSHNLLTEDSASDNKKSNAHRRRSSSNLLEEIQVNESSLDSDSSKESLNTRVNKKKSTMKKKKVAAPLKFKIDSMHVEEKSSPKLLRKFKYEVIVEEGNLKNRISIKSSPNLEKESPIKTNIPKVYNETIENATTYPLSEGSEKKELKKLILESNPCDNKCDMKTKDIDNVLPVEEKTNDNAKPNIKISSIGNKVNINTIGNIQKTDIIKNGVPKGKVPESTHNLKNIKQIKAQSLVDEKSILKIDDALSTSPILDTSCITNDKIKIENKTNCNTQHVEKNYNRDLKSVSEASSNKINNAINNIKPTETVNNSEIKLLSSSKAQNLNVKSHCFEPKLSLEVNDTRNNIGKITDSKTKEDIQSIKNDQTINNEHDLKKVTLVKLAYPKISNNKIINNDECSLPLNKFNKTIEPAISVQLKTIESDVNQKTQNTDTIPSLNVKPTSDDCKSNVVKFNKQKKQPKAEENLKCTEIKKLPAQSISENKDNTLLSNGNKADTTQLPIEQACGKINTNEGKNNVIKISHENITLNENRSNAGVTDASKPEIQKDIISDSNKRENLIADTRKIIPLNHGGVGNMVALKKTNENKKEDHVQSAFIQGNQCINKDVEKINKEKIDSQKVLMKIHITDKSDKTINTQLDKNKKTDSNSHLVSNLISKTELPQVKKITAKGNVLIDHEKESKIKTSSEKVHTENKTAIPFIQSDIKSAKESSNAGNTPLSDSGEKVDINTSKNTTVVNKGYSQSISSEIKNNIPQKNKNVLDEIINPVGPKNETDKSNDAVSKLPKSKLIVSSSNKDSNESSFKIGDKTEIMNNEDIQLKIPGKDDKKSNYVEGDISQCNINDDNIDKKKRLKSESDLPDKKLSNETEIIPDDSSKTVSKKNKKSKSKSLNESVKSVKKKKKSREKNESSIKKSSKFPSEESKKEEQLDNGNRDENTITTKTISSTNVETITSETTLIIEDKKNTTNSDKTTELSKRSTRLMHFINKCLKLSEDNESIIVEMSDEDTSSDYSSDSEYTDSEDETLTDDSDECDVNCHRKCEKLMPNLCGVNQKLIVEALSSLKKGSSDHEHGSGSPTRRHSNAALSLDEVKSERHSGPGRVTPPATTIPKFRKYTMDDFQFLKVLGKGSFGKVLLAELRGTQYYYAVKCLKKDVVLEDDDVECTLIERKVLALGTNHPYLCHLFCTFQTDSHLFFVMEYLNGGDLMFHIQQQGRFDEGRARFYAAEIISGLKFLHKKGIVYRDLKLDNILLDFDGHVRIADFGMCKLQIYLDRTADTFCGTPDYMAPEIIKGLKYNQCVDWWSFGILLYEMLVGQSPFSGCDEDDLFWCICNRQPHYPRFITLEAKRILTQLLEKEACKRLGSCENGAEEVMGHPFFNGLDWDRLEHRELIPPFKPNVKHPLDVHYFDKHFTAERACLTPIDPSILQSMDQAQFQGFSYTNPNVTD